MLPYHPYLGPVVALVAGILILIQPALLSLIVAVYLIVTGILGLMGARPPADGGRENLRAPGLSARLERCTCAQWGPVFLAARPGAGSKGI